MKLVFAAAIGFTLGVLFTRAFTDSPDTATLARRVDSLLIAVNRQTAVIEGMHHQAKKEEPKSVYFH